MIGRVEQIRRLGRVGTAEPESALLVVGPSGIGRTTILRELHSTAALPTVFITARPSDREIALSGLSMLFRGLGDTRLNEYVDRIDPAEHATIVVTSLVTFVCALDLAPVLLVVDDLDTLDLESQQILGGLAARLSGTGMSLVGSISPATTRFAGLPVLVLPPITVDDGLELAAGTIGPWVDRATVEIICRESAGLPGVIAGQLAGLTPHQLTGRAPLVFPLRSSGTRRAVSVGDGPMSDLVRRLSAAPLTSLTSLAAGSDTSRQRADLDELLSRGVAATNGSCAYLVDPGLRSAVYWGMTADERLVVHLLAAEMEATRRPALAVWHRSHAGAATVPSAALFGAATELIKEGHVAAAVELCDRGLLSVDGTFPVELLMCVEALLLHGEFALVNRYASQHLHRFPTGAQALRSVGMVLAAEGLTSSHLRLDDAGVFVDHHAEAYPAEAASLLALASFLLVSQADIRQARSYIDRARSLAPESGSPDLIYWTRRILAASDGGEAPEPPPDLPAGRHFAGMKPPLVLTAGWALSLEEQHQEARHAFDEVLVMLPRDGRAQVWHDIARRLAAENEVRAGELGRACRLIASVTRTDDAHRFRDSLLRAWRARMVWDGSEQDHLDECEDVLAAHPNPVNRARLLAQQGSSALLRDDPVEAVVHLRAAISGPTLPHTFLRCLPDLIEGHLWAGERVKAVAAMREFEAQMSPRSPWTRLTLARCRALLAPEETVTAAFDSALAAPGLVGSPYEHARTLASCLRFLVRSGLTTESTEIRRRARDLFDDQELPLWPVFAESGSRDTDGPTRRTELLAGLTDSELAVLHLMVRGTRNREIASALFLSLRTVEVRITQIYRKLHARSRSHLLQILKDERIESHFDATGLRDGWSKDLGSVRIRNGAAARGAGPGAGGTAQQGLREAAQADRRIQDAYQREGQSE
ncbi:hypothetical protein D1871_22195 [Nakamurella silvestris]|nr:hypothetical protein D1871_22195 [Nakamurella silvestris]